MKELDIVSLLKKTEELRALFVLGQRVIPFLEEIFLFIQELTPQLAKISRSIEENLRNIPNASKQLEQVTKATEMATTEILNALEGITYKASVIQANAREIQALIDRQEASRKQVIYRIQRLIDEGNPAADELREIKTVLQRMDVHTQVQKATEEAANLMESISNDATQIMMTLQVQDITAQQLAAVNHLIEETQQQLRSIVERFYTRGFDRLLDDLEVEIRQKPGKQPPEKAKVTKLHREIAFDEEAIVGLEEAGQQRQQVVEELMEQFESGELNEPSAESTASESGVSESPEGARAEAPSTAEAEQPSQEAEAPSSPPASETPAQGPSTSQEEDDGKKPIAQDDINALFD